MSRKKKVVVSIFVVFELLSSFRFRFFYLWWMLNFLIGMLNSILCGRGKTSLLVRCWFYFGYVNLVVLVMIRNIEIISSS